MHQIQQTPHRGYQRRSRKWLIGIAALALLSAALAPWARQKLLFFQANRAFESATPMAALLATSHLLRSFPDHAEAAELYLRAHRRAAKLPSDEIRERLLLQFPLNESIRNEIALAEFQDGKLALAASRLVDGASLPTGIEAMRLAMIVAFTRGDQPQASIAARQLAIHREATGGDRLAAAQILLQSPDIALIDLGVELLRSLARGDLQRQAWVQLARQSHARDAASEAIEAIAALEPGDPDFIFTQLDLLAANQHPDLSRRLADAQQKLRLPSDCARLVGWLNHHGAPKAALEWTQQLPQVVQTHQAMRLAMAEAFLYAGDREGLYQHLLQGRWQFDESLRLALIALCLRDEKQQGHYWNQAIEEANRTNTMDRFKSVLGQWQIQHPAIAS